MRSRTRQAYDSATVKALLLLLALAAPVYGQSINEGKNITKWTPVSVAPDVTQRVDKETSDNKMRIEGSGRMEMSFANVQRSGDTFKGWVRFIFPSSAIVSEGRWNEVRFYVNCDCRKNIIKALKAIAYGVDGRIRVDEGKQVLAHAVPGSIGHQLFEYFCERGGGAPTGPPTLKPIP